MAAKLPSGTLELDPVTGAEGIAGSEESGVTRILGVGACHQAPGQPNQRGHPR